jgi:hypothetical protein
VEATEGEEEEEEEEEYDEDVGTVEILKMLMACPY